MPELPEVETVRRGLSQLTLHQTIQDVFVHLDRTVAYPPLQKDFKSGLIGGAIAQWHRRGKYLLAELVDNPAPLTVSPTDGAISTKGWLGVHLRMTGQLLWVDQQEPIQKYCRVRLLFPNEKELRFVDQRTFGRMWWVPPDKHQSDVMTGLQRLGPEPLSDDFSVAYFKQALHKRHKPIKNALLDQAIVAGIGNIYADESLFMSKIRPTTFCDQISDRRLKSLHASIIEVLEASIMKGGTTFSDFRDIKGTNGNYGQVAWVYGRTGEPCKTCNQPIERLKLAGRSTHFCSQCQR
ncbi:MAG: DNA-formamidopyrimidine glycosylase [Cyanobacteria bacterium P01_F01_bin.150]